MNRTLTAALIAIASVAASSTAFADDITVEATPFVSTLSRAQVQAELQQYKQSGVNPWSTSYNQLRSFQGSKSRAQVVSDFLQTRDETAALTSEDSGSAWLAARTPSVAAPILAGQPVNAQ
jgi:hypothetical protein